MTTPDVLIIGGGPAGMSALLWCRSLNLTGVLLEGAPEPGGQMLQMFHPIPDYPGLPGLTGREMRDRFVDQLRELGLDWRTDCRVESIDPLTRTVTWAGGELQAQGLVIATGARKRTLDVPGADRFALRGVSFSGTRDHSLYAGREVCVIGGGDSAIENCLILARVCPVVTLIHRSDRFRARQAWLDEARSTRNIRFMLNTDVVSIEGEESVTGIVIRDRQDGAISRLETGAVFIKIGITPNTEALVGHLASDDGGYIIVNQRQQTSLDWVYAVGDVTNPVCLSVATAVGQAAIAVKDIKERLERAV
ncbi:MAG: NAD(P)/FAD-dependent oxidoreductase [Acidobacteriota bacterium]